CGRRIVACAGRLVALAGRLIVLAGRLVALTGCLVAVAGLAARSLVEPLVEQLGELAIELVGLDRRRLGAGEPEALEQPGRVVDLLGARQQIRVGPEAVAARGAAALGDEAPQRRRLAQPPRPQLEAHECSEGVLRRA